MLKIAAALGGLAVASASPLNAKTFVVVPKPAVDMTMPVDEHGHVGEVWNQAQTEAHGIVWRGNDTKSPLPHEYMDSADLPVAHDWRDINGTNFCTMSRNQHIPQYCGSCWAHGSVSALGDRVKIARGGKGIDVNVAVQHILNCGDVGSCHGGSVDGPYQWLKDISDKTGTGISYETSNPYVACSSESTEGLCTAAKWTCTPENIARTCSTFPPAGKCSGLSKYPNVTISEFGSISGKDAMQKEIFARGPISCGIDASPILKYTGGIAKMAGQGVDHVISVVGWGDGYWIVRNSWGEFWGEMGYIRVAFGALLVESQCSWAVVKDYSSMERQPNFPCFEGGENCAAGGPSPPPPPGPSPSPPSPPSPGGDPWADPNAGPCPAGSESVQITGLQGNFCSPDCSASKPCPAAPAGVTAQAECALSTAGGSTPTQCALICKPSHFGLKGAAGGCPDKATCKAIQTTGICTFDSR